MLSTVVRLAATAALTLTGVGAGHTVVRVTPDDPQGWSVHATTSSLVAGPRTSGRGSLAFTGGLLAARDVVVEAADLREIAADVRAGNDRRTYRLSVYVDTFATGHSFYDCRYDYPIAVAAGRWRTVTARRATPAVVAARNGADCGRSLADLGRGATVFRVAVGADPGGAGGLDTVEVTSTTGRTTYDFEP